MQTASPPVREYSGQCHCGKVRFRFLSVPITTGCRCNCSICTRKGTVMSSHYVEPIDLISLDGRESLAVYQFGDRLVNHYFCRVCGIYPFHEGVETPGRYRFNLGCVAAIDPCNLEISLIDGRSF
jgi:hypothetical protein